MVAARRKECESLILIWLELVMDGRVNLDKEEGKREKDKRKETKSGNWVLITGQRGLYSCAQHKLMTLKRRGKRKKDKQREEDNKSGGRPI